MNSMKNNPYRLADKICVTYPSDHNSYLKGVNGIVKEIYDDDYYGIQIADSERLIKAHWLELTIQVKNSPNPLYQ